MKLSLVPISLREANSFVEAKHRHHGASRGHLFSIAVALEGQIVGVAIIGRPVARMLQDGYTAEVNRLCTDGTKNTCSFLYAAAWRSVRAMGYRRLVTYILDSESGISLQAAGWRCVGAAGGGSWDCPSRPRVDTHPLQKKIRYEVAA
jgi:tRNA A37 N6-isopentenylltransferase MiaA